MFRLPHNHSHNHIMEYNLKRGSNEFILPECTIKSIYVSDSVVNNINLSENVSVNFKNYDNIDLVYKVKSRRLNNINYKFKGGLIYVLLPDTQIYGKFFVTV